MKRCVPRGLLSACLAVVLANSGRAQEARTDRYGDPLPEGAFAHLGTLRFRAPGWLNHVAFAPDGKTIACTSGREVLLWDAATGKEVRRFRVHEDDTFSLLFSPDGKALATVGDGTVRLWDPSTGKRLRQHEGRACAFSPDGKILATLDRATGGKGFLLSLWGMADGKLSRRLTLPTPIPPLGSRIFRIAFSPDNKTVAVSSGTDSMIGLWDTRTGRQTHILDGHSYILDGIQFAFAADGKTLASADRHTVRLWDLTTGKVRKSWDDPPFAGPVAFSPDGKWLAWGGFGQIVIWETAGDKPPRPVAGALYGPATLAFSPDGKTLAAGSLGAVRLFDATTGRERRLAEGHGDVIDALAFTPDEQALVTLAEDSIIVWDRNTHKERRRLLNGWPPNPAHLGQLPDGKGLVRTVGKEGVEILDLNTGKRTQLEGRPGRSGFLCSGDGKLLALAWVARNLKVESGSLQIYETATGKLLHRIEQPSQEAHWHFQPVGFSPDGKTLIARGLGPTRYHLYDTATGKSLSPFGGQKLTSPVAFSPDGRLLATPAPEGKVRLWDRAEKRERPALRGPYHSARSVFFSPDGRYLGACVWLDAENEWTERSSVLLWDLARGQRIAHFGKRQGVARGATFTPDGRGLLTLDGAGVLRLWEVATGAERARFENGDLDPDRFNDLVRFTRDGRTLATASGTAVLLWDLTGRTRRPAR
ncbi:MAG: WD40 repeat domain-containing protein [Gemmataceae bacterium]|nr:WD40 repeat domain-containing protein [Gemmataceae bacterium]